MPWRGSPCPVSVDVDGPRTRASALRTAASRREPESCCPLRLPPTVRCGSGRQRLRRGELMIAGGGLEDVARREQLPEGVAEGAIAQEALPPARARGSVKGRPTRATQGRPYGASERA
jgi:hypothetical protein